MGYSVFGSNIVGSNIVLQETTESTVNYLVSTPITNTNLALNMRSTDTICTSTLRDTLRINSIDKATDYTWSLPPGAFLFKKISDTTIIVDWSNAAIGLSNICVAAQNTCGTSDNSCLEVFITNCNTKPIATDDFELTTINTTKTIHVQTNDFDPDGDELVTLLDSNFSPSNGSLSILKLAINYSPATNYTGIDSFQYIICDNNHPSLCDTAKVRITIDHQTPIAIDDKATTNANTSIVVPVQNNDNDPEGSILTTFLDSLNLPLNGQVRVDGPNIIYLPNRNFTGIDRFGYILCDDGSPIKCTESNITITVTNNPPIAINDTINTTINIPVNTEVQLNDIDAENGILVTILDNSHLPMNGLLTLDGNNIIYTPALSFNGTDQFNYVICDNGSPSLCDTATVIVIIGNTYPIAVNDTTFTDSNTPVNIDVLNNDFDPDGGLLIVTIDSTLLPLNGLVSLENNEIIFTPTIDFTGIDSISYIICDGGTPSLCDTALIHIEVGNSSPIASDDTATTPSNTSILIPVQDNDLDTESGNLITLIDSLKLPLNGQVTISGNDLLYIPNLNFTGIDRFDYILCDNGNPQKCSQATVTIAITNNPPIAINDTINTTINIPINAEVQLNDIDIENGILITMLDNSHLPMNGLLTLDGDNIIYTPALSFNGTDQFNYVICDNGSPSLCDTATVIVAIGNTYPIAVNDTTSINSNTPVNIDVLNNDFDPDGGLLIVTIDSTMLPLNGLVTVENNEIIFTPISGFTGIDSISYIICDGGTPSLCDTALIHIEVGNSFPIASDDTATTTSNTSILIPVQDNDLDTESDNLITLIDSLKLPLNGQVTINGNDLFYIPNLNFTGIDRFDYILCDDGNPQKCSQATVTIVVTNASPIAVNDTVYTSINNSINIAVLSNDSDRENGILITSLDTTNVPTSGLISLDGNRIIYIPTENSSGTDQFQYTICDNGSPILCDTAIVWINIINSQPIAANDTIFITSNTPISVNVLANDIDPDGGILRVRIDSTLLPTNGLVTVNDTLIVFTPTPGFTGTDSISYIICDDAVPSLCDTALVIIEAGNTTPVAEDDFAKTGISTPITIAILSNDFDPESGTLSVTIDSNNPVRNGTLVITTTDSTSNTQNGALPQKNYLIIYTPITGYIGLDSFAYVLCDDGNPVLCDTAIVTIEIFNNPPVAIDDYIVTQEGNPITSSVLINDFDPDGDPLTVELLSNPAKGIVRFDDGQYTYIPSLYENGRDSFTYILCEAIAPFQCDTAFVYIDIFPKNDPPIAINDINLTLENTATAGNVLTNDFDPEGDQINIARPIIMFPENGQVDLETNGDYIYRPDFLFIGEDKFAYKICDDGIPSFCDTAYVIIHVIGTDISNSRPPIGVNDYFQMLVNDQINGDIIGNDIAPSGAIISINTAPISSPKNGTVEIASTGSFDFTPTRNRIGLETFEYEVCNVGASDLCDTVLVQIEILPNIGNSIFATDDAAAGLEDELIQGNILVNDIDPEGDDKMLQTVPILPPSNGTLVLQENGDFSYQPNEDYNGPDNFIYEICDNGIPQACDRATVSLVLFPVSDTLCNVDITTPIISGANSVCGNDSIYLFVQINASPLTVENQDNELEYMWFNGAGDTIAITNDEQLSLAISPLTVSPFSMKVRSQFCTSPLSNFLEVEIIDLPEIIISLDKNKDTLCENTSFQLLAPSISGVRYEWTIKDNSTIISQEQNLIIEGIPESVTYQLSLLSEVCESISISTKTVYIYPNVSRDTPPIVALQDNGTCGNNTLILNANIPSSSEAYEVNWTGPNNYTSFMAIDSIESATTAANGQYTLVLTDSNTCETTSKILVSTVTPSVTKPIITSAEGPVCENGNILLQAPSYEGKEDAYVWYKNGSIVENASSNQLFIDDAQLQDSFSVAIALENCALQSNVFVPFVFEKPTISLDSAFQLFCSSGTESIDLTTNIEGGKTPYNIQWVGPNNFSSANPSPTIINASIVNTGTYTILVKDQNDCVADASTSVDIIDGLPTPIIALVSGSCDGDQLELSVTNYEGQEVNYNWTVPNETGIVNLTASSIRIPSANDAYKGRYLLTTNSGRCAAQSDTFHLDNFNVITATPLALYEKTENCAAANLELFANATGSNLSYQWTGPNGFTSNLMNPVITNANTDNNGIYELSISNPQGCSIIAATNIIDNIQNGFPEPVLKPSGLICAGGYITLTAPVYTGSSVSYTWLENGITLANENSPVLVAGPQQTNGVQYELVVQVDDCTLRSDPYFTDVIEDIDLEIDYEISSNCGAASLQLFAAVSLDLENFKFSWTGPNGFTAEALVATIINPNPAHNGLYTLRISNESGCESSANLVIDNLITPPDIPLIKLINDACETAVQLIVENESPQGNYSWTNSDGVIIGNSARLDLSNNTVTGNGPYQVAINVDGCAAISSLPYEIESIEESIIQLGNSGPVCRGSDVTLFATKLAGYNYEWYDEKEELIATESSTIVNTLNEAATYSLVVTKDGCTNGRTQQTEVLIKAIPTIINITKSETYCEGETILLTAQNQNPTGEIIRYTWTGPNGFNYIEETSTDSFNLVLPAINIGQAGSYTLQIKTPNGCSSATNSVLVNLIPGITAPTLEVEQNAICAGSTLSLQAKSTAVTAIAYQWYMQEGTASPTLIGTTELPNYVIENATSDNSGTYIVKAVNEECASNFSNQVPILIFDVNSDLNIASSATENKPGCYGDLLQLSLPFYETATYRWFGPAGFTATSFNPIIESIDEIHQGEYFAIVKMEGCQEIKTNPINVVINPKPATPTMISSGPICKGDDLEFKVSSIVENSSAIRFDWFNENDLLIASTDIPLRSFNNVPTSFSGQYYLEIVANSCTSDPSPLITVQINDPADVQAYAGEDQEFCATAKITLAATEALVGQGRWTTIDGGDFVNADLATTEVDQLQKGANQFIWTVEDPVCAVLKTDTVSIFVGNLTSDQAIAGVDQDLCEEYTTQLSAIPLTASTGRWTQSPAQAQQGVQINNPTNPQTTVNGLDAGNAYSFNWTISQADCPDFETDELTINVNDIPEEYAIIQEEVLYLCAEDKTNLDAELPGLSTGQWSYLLDIDTTATPSTEEIKIAAATNPSTFVEGIPTGNNTFIWSLSNGACRDFSTDTIRIINAAPLIANPDNYVINLNDSLAIDILSNDQFDSESPFNIIITKHPDFGKLIENENGTYMYQPINNYFGRDNFRYQICDPNCETLCDTARVDLAINGIEGSGSCFIPNVISPNKDGNNDIFKVACIDDFPKNQLSIFNRWGDKVYAAAPYRNDWAGTYQGQDLPAGTYFYMLQLSDVGEPLQGFITIFR